MCNFLMCENLLDVFPYSPHHGSHVKKDNISLLHQITVDRYLFIDFRFIYPIPASEEHR